MAPPQHPFPVSDLDNQVHTHAVGHREKSRKLGRDFNLKDCELFELVQYSCTTQEQQWERSMGKTPDKSAQIECFPFVRLFRRCGAGDKVFHVETTAWEGQHAWSAVPKQSEKEDITLSEKPQIAQQGLFARLQGYLWSQK